MSSEKRLYFIGKNVYGQWFVRIYPSPGAEPLYPSIQFDTFAEAMDFALNPDWNLVSEIPF